MTPVSLISGGSRGLGLTIVESLLARGDRVATFSRSGSPALSVLAAAHPDQLHVDQLDAADSPAIQAFVNRVAARFGRIDHCIANAAIAQEGVLATMRDVRQMLMGDSAGRTVTLISSVVAERGSPGLSVYAATKAALEGFGISLARELGPRGIRVNTVAPGFLETDLSAPLSPSNRDRIARRTALGRLGSAADVVGFIDHLSRPAGGFLTGLVLAADGGA